jgi:hypothetical protein
MATKKTAAKPAKKVKAKPATKKVTAKKAATKKAPAKKAAAKKAVAVKPVKPVKARKGVKVQSVDDPGTATVGEAATVSPHLDPDTGVLTMVPQKS